MQAKSNRPIYGAFLHECCDRVIGPFKQRKMKLLAGEKRYQRWRNEFGEDLLIMFRNHNSLAYTFREGQEECRAAAFEMLYLQKRYSDREKLVQDAFNSNSRYLRVRALGLCVWLALYRDSIDPITSLKHFAECSTGVERMVALLHLNSIRIKTPPLDNRLFDMDRSPKEQSILQQVSSIDELDWSILVSTEFDLIVGMILLRDAKLAVTAGVSRLTDWCTRFGESLIIAIRDKSYAEELIGLTFGRSWIAAMEILVLSHHREEPIGIVQRLLGPYPDFRVCSAGIGLISSIYEGTSNKEALDFLDGLQSQFPSSVDVCFLIEKEKILGVTS